MKGFKDWVFGEAKKVQPVVHPDVDKWLTSVDNLKKDLEKLKSKFKDIHGKKQEEKPKQPGLKHPDQKEEEPEERKEIEKDQEVEKEVEKEIESPEKINGRSERNNNQKRN